MNSNLLSLEPLFVPKKGPQTLLGFWAVIYRIYFVLFLCESW